ncbi:MAG: hypothetical protein QOF98_117 [Streptomyces sp.]|jgi:hypothetical protein|nr:hypothetical protein [Streptomyces sp.]
MRKVILSMPVCLDGFIEDLGLGGADLGMVMLDYVR